MFCPYCSAPLTVVGGEATCANGGGFSQHMTLELSAFVAAPPTEAKPYGRMLGTRWRCPADGEQLVEYEGRLRCPSCAREPRELMLYELFEFNPHGRRR